MKFIFCLLAFALAPQVAMSQTSSVDRLIARHIEALGGASRIEAIHAYVKHGTYKEGDLELGDTYLAQMRPFYRVIGSPEHELDSIHEGYDGSSWEYYPDPGLVVRTVSQAARSARHAAQNFVDRLVDAKRMGTSVTLQGERQYFGHEAYVLRCVLSDGFVEDLFLDKETFLIDGRAQVVPMHAFGTPYHTNDVYSEYRLEGGVMMPHHDAEIDANTGRVLDENTLKSGEINPPLSEQMFSPPEWRRTPLQKMIDLIYKERDGTDAVLETYRSFRTVVDFNASTTGDAVDFVGYQCLKMGETKTAVALLRLNVADHPRSARAHFGLGRALATDGEKSAAESEFRAALSIDPNYRRAQSAIDALK